MRDSQCGAADGKAYSGSLLPSSTASLFPDNLFAHRLPPLSLGGIMRSCTWLNHIKKKKKNNTHFKRQFHSNLPATCTQQVTSPQAVALWIKQHYFRASMANLSPVRLSGHLEEPLGLPHLGGHSPSSPPATQQCGAGEQGLPSAPPDLPASHPPRGPDLTFSSREATRAANSMTQPTAMRAAPAECSSFQTVSLSTWANSQPQEKGKGERERERERESMRENKPVREGWQRDSPCTITSVFRPGQLKGLLDMALLMLFLCTGFSNGNTFLSCLAAIPCLDFSLQTALHRPGWACSPASGRTAPGPYIGGDGGLPARDMRTHKRSHCCPKKACRQKLTSSPDHDVF